MQMLILKSCSLDEWKAMLFLETKWGFKISGIGGLTESFYQTIQNDTTYRRLAAQTLRCEKRNYPSRRLSGTDNLQRHSHRRAGATCGRLFLLSASTPQPALATGLRGIRYYQGRAIRYIPLWFAPARTLARVHQFRRRTMKTMRNNDRRKTSTIVHTTGLQ